MELSFTQKNPRRWEAEFIATADFNLHIERQSSGFLFVQQRTSSIGEYDSISGANFALSDPIIDVDMVALVYPKYIKIVSEVEPTFAEVISDGEITEIKSQSKEVEIVSNGTTEISPDAGFAYLNSVKVKTNVPQEGGGGSGLRYFNTQGLGDIFGAPAIDTISGMLPVVTIKVNKENAITIIPMDAARTQLTYGVITADNVVAVSVANTKTYANGEWETTEEMLANLADMVVLTEITEEEFYNLES